MAAFTNENKGRHRAIFLVVGIVFALLSAAAWVANWYLPDTRLGYAFFTYAALATYILSLISLFLWMARLKNKQLVLAIVFFVFTSALVYVITQLIEANYLEFFSFTRELFRGKSIAEYDSRYVTNWGNFFLYPFLYILNGALILLSLSALVVWIKKRTNDTKAYMNPD